MKKGSSLLLFLLFSSVIHLMAQSGSVKGILKDTTVKQSLKGATVSILEKTDSSVVLYGLAEEDGIFQLRKIPAGPHILSISFQGYETKYKPINILADSTVSAGTIYLQMAANNLGNVTVEAPPVVVKKDTVEYNASMFKTKPNAVAEDLLKKLPGVDVGTDGTVKAQGEQVQRILVDGKRFFGDDPKMATKNLPPDVIDKIQVFDDLSDQSKFTGFDDGNRVKTINITTKKNMRKGYFGRAIAGVGNKGLYDEALNLSRFKGDQQMTVIGQANNTNNQNFTTQDILGAGGGGGRGYGGGGGRGGGGMQPTNNNNGITKTLAGGINYRDSWGKNTDFSGSYFYNNMQVEKDQKSATENLYPGQPSQFNDKDQSSANKNINNRLNLNLETNFDSANSMIIRPNVSWQESDNSSQSISNTVKSDKITPVNSIAANSSSYNSGYNGTADVLFRHKFKKKARTVSFDLNFGGSSNDGNGTNYSLSKFHQSTGDSVNTINQQYVSKSNSQSISTTVSYTEPVTKNSILEFNYNYSYNKNTSDKTTYDYNSDDQKYSIVDSLLTNAYENTYHSNRLTLNYRIQSKKMNLSFGSGVQFGDLTSINRTKNLDLSQHYTNIYPTANFNYKFTPTSNLRFNYSGRTAQPNVQQLQPVIDNSDPMNVKVGNPLLKQSFTNSFRMLYTNFDNVKFRNMFASVNASFVGNAIVNATTTNLKTGVDTLIPVNMNGSYNISAFFNYGIQLKHPKSNLNFTTNFTDSRSVGLVRTFDSVGAQPLNKQNITTNYTIGESVKWTTNLKDNFDLNFTATPTYNIAKYSIQPSQNANYFSLILGVEPTYYTKSGWVLSSNFNYTYYGGRATGYNTSVPLWNASIAKQVLKNKRGEIKFTVFDLLNQNVSVTRNITDNYIQDVHTKVLTRYALLTFTYNLRTFKGAAPQQQRNRMGPPFMRDGGGGRMGRPGGMPGGGMPPPPPGE